MQRVILLLGISLGIEGIYVGGAWMFFRTDFFHHLINPPTSEVDISYGGGWSPFPGLIYAHDVVVAGDHGAAQWRLEVERAQVYLNVFSFFRRKVLFYGATGAGAKIKINIATDLPVPKPKVISGKAKKPSWAFILHHIQISRIDAIAVNDYQFNGQSNLKFNFLYDYNDDLPLPGMSLEVREGSLAIHDQVIATLRPSFINADIQAFNTNSVSFDEVVAKTDLSIMTTAQVNDVAFLNYYLEEISWLRLKSGDGELQADLRVHNGSIAPASFIQFDTQDLATTIVQQTATGNGAVRLFVNEEPRQEVMLKVVLDAFTLRGKGNSQSDVFGKNMLVSVASSDLRLLNPFVDWRLCIKIPDATVKNLRYIGSFLPRGSGFRIKGGRGSLRADLDISSSDHHSPAGVIHIKAEKMHLSYEKVSLLGDMQADMPIRGANLATGTFDISGTVLNFKNFNRIIKTADGSAQYNHWYGSVATQNSHMTIGDRNSFRGEVSAKGRDLWPVVSILATFKEMPDWLQSLLAIENVSGRAMVRADETSLAVDDALAQGDGFHIKGWFYRSSKKKEAVALVEYGAVEAGLSLIGEDVDYKIIHPADWYEEALQQKQQRDSLRK